MSKSKTSGGGVNISGSTVSQSAIASGEGASASVHASSTSTEPTPAVAAEVILRGISGILAEQQGSAEVIIEMKQQLDRLEQQMAAEDAEPSAVESMLDGIERTARVFPAVATAVAATKTILLSLVG